MSSRSIYFLRLSCFTGIFSLQFTPRLSWIQYLIAHIIIFLIQKMCESIYRVFVVVDGFDVMTYFWYDLVLLNFMVENVIRLTQLHAQYVLRRKIDIAA